MQMGFNKMALACVVVAGSALMAACGGGSDSPPPAPAVATANLSIVPSATNGATVAPAFVAVTKPALVFPNGFTGSVSLNGKAVTVPAGTTVAFTTGTDAAKPNVFLNNASITAQGLTTFGSCTFTFDTVYDFLGQNKTLYLDPCSIVIPTEGKTADGSTQNLPISVTLGDTTVTQTLPVVISATGGVSVNGVSVGTVTVQVPTGATGGSN